MLRPLDVATGLVVGAAAAPGLRGDEPGHDARHELHDAVARALQRPPCYLAFSGGRDSSLLLAVAVHVARERGLELPIALTARYPGHPDTVETKWQDMVARHVRLDDWV